MSELAIEPARRQARRALRHYGAAFRIAGLMFLALGLGHLLGLSPDLPFDSYTWYAVSFLGCQMIGLSLTLGNALEGAGERGFLKAAAITLLLFAAMRLAYLVADATLRGVAGPALLVEILLFSGIALSFLILRSRL